MMPDVAAATADPLCRGVELRVSWLTSHIVRTDTLRTRNSKLETVLHVSISRQTVMNHAASMVGPCLWVSMRRAFVLAVLLSFLPLAAWAATKQVGTGNSSSGSLPIDVTAARLDYRQDQEVYEADGSVVVRQGALTLRRTTSRFNHCPESLPPRAMSI